MKLATLTKTFDLATARAGNRLDWMRVITLGLVVTGAVLLQGRLVGAWVTLMAVDTMKSGHITFWPFE